MNAERLIDQDQLMSFRELLQEESDVAIKNYIISLKEMSAELRKSVENHDRNTLMRSTHFIKSPSRQLGALDTAYK